MRQGGVSAEARARCDRLLALLRRRNKRPSARPFAKATQGAAAQGR